jgi:heme-degrading monooxygenase HmoA
MQRRVASRIPKKQRLLLQLFLQLWATSAYAATMTTQISGTIAVIFVAQRTELDPEGYAAAAQQMVSLAAAQPGYVGVDSVRDAAGLGITVSYWANDAAAKAWRDHPDHSAIREAGRNRWYSYYSLHVAAIERSYDWERGN